MVGRTRHIEGFTLAELLLAIAVVLVLAAIAIPSIIAAQSNLRMLELNNAAEQIANAAQTQMTAKKVSGTWWSIIQKGGTGADAADCAYPEATGAPGSGGRTLHYLTADQARAAGIVAALSVDEDVRSGAYVIEFDADTASVSRVFYADGKSGFFGSADPASAQGVYAYYGTGGGSTNVDVRKDHTPMIGLYDGTPSGATAEKALKNPVVSVDQKTGRLWVQDPNLDKATGSGDTATTLKLEKANLAENEEPAAFRISGLSSGTQAVVVSLVSEADDEDQGSYAAKVQLSDLGFLDQVNQNTGEGTGNVFSLDLNALVRAVENASASPGSGDIAAVLKRFASGDQVKVQAATRLVPNSAKCIPATATAYIEWPAPASRITLMITDPYSEAVQDEDVPGAEGGQPNAAGYQAPTVEATSDSPIYSAEYEPTSADFPMKSTAANKELVKRNKQAGYQSYIGGWVPYDRAAGDDTFKLRVNAGSYTGTSVHRYQVWELWVQRSNGDYTRAGYLRNNVWEWASGFAALETCLTWYDADGNEYGSITGENVADLGIVSAAVSGGAASFDALDDLGLLDEDRNASIFVRTAPSMDDVQTFFDRYAAGDLKKDLQGNFRTGSRGYGYGLTLPIRQKYEQEFGASSSDVSWVVAQGSDGGLGSQGNRFLAADNLRVYYSVAPGVAFDNIRSNSNYLRLASTEMTDVALWLYRDGKGVGKLEAQPAALVQSGLGGSRYYCGGTAAADFELPTESDRLFYRVIEYCDDEGAALAAYDMQYVPYTVQDDPAYATIRAGINKNSEDVFTGWACSTTQDGQTIGVRAGEQVGAYNDSLAFGYNQLKGKYVKVGIGLVYFETYADGSSGYYGYVSETQTDPIDPTLQKESAISSWGYRLIVPYVEGDKSFPAATVSTWPDRSLTEQDHLVIDGMEYRSFSFNDGIKTSTKTMTYTFRGKTATYTFNINFACAVAREGGNPQTEKLSTGESAWNVRHAMQFPGSLSWYNNASSIQSMYQADNYVQTRSIDMLTIPAGSMGYATKYQYAFRGVYDGGNYAIKNVHNRFLQKQADISIVDLSGVRAWGLFPAISSATLMNIAIVEDGTTGPLNLVGTNGFSFGMLAGYAENSTIEQCTVEGSGNDVQVKATATNTVTVIGGLVGRASSSTITGCSASNLALSLSSNGNAAWAIEPSMGGLVGHMIHGRIQPEGDSGPSEVAADVKLSITTASSSETYLQYYGAVVGRAEGAAVIESSFARRVLMTGTARADGTADTMRAGTYIGRYDGTGDPITGGGAPSDIRQRYGDEEPTAVTAKIGYPHE